MEMRFIPKNGLIVQQATEVLVGSEIKARQAVEVAHKQYLNKGKATRSAPIILQNDGSLKQTYDTPFGKCYVVHSYSTQTNSREPYRKNSSVIDGIQQLFSGQSYKKRYVGDDLLDGDRVTGVYIEPKAIRRISTSGVGVRDRSKEYTEILQNIAEFKENLQFLQNVTNTEWINFFSQYENKIFYKIIEHTTTSSVWLGEVYDDKGRLEYDERFVGIGSFDNFYIDDDSASLYRIKMLPSVIYEKIKFGYKLSNGTIKATNTELTADDTIIDIVEFSTNQTLQEVVQTETNEPTEFGALQKWLNTIEKPDGKWTFLFSGENGESEAIKMFGKPKQGGSIFRQGVITSKGFYIKEQAITEVDTRYDDENPNPNGLQSLYTTGYMYYAMPLFRFGTDNPVCRSFYFFEIWNDIFTFRVTHKKSKFARYLGFVQMVIAIVAMAIAVVTQQYYIAGTISSLTAASSYLGALSLAFMGFSLGASNPFFKRMSAIFGVLSTLVGIGAVVQEIGKRASQMAVKEVAKESAKNFSKDMAQKTATSLYDKFMNSAVTRVFKVAYKALSAIIDCVSAFRGGDLPEQGERAETQKQKDENEKSRAKGYAEIGEPSDILAEPKFRRLSQKWLPSERLDLWRD